MNNISKCDFWLIGWVVKECECVLHPRVIESLSEIVSGVRASGLLSILGSEHGHLCLDHEVFELQGFNQVCVPDVTAVGDADVGNALGGIMEGRAALLKIVLTAENGSVLLHSLLHV